MLCLALDARSLGRVRPDAHDHLADVVAAQQRQERLRRTRNAVHHGLAHADAITGAPRSLLGLASCLLSKQMLHTQGIPEGIGTKSRIYVGIVPML